jgi:hypothetical protein
MHMYWWTALVVGFRRPVANVALVLALAEAAVRNSLASANAEGTLTAVLIQPAPSQPFVRCLEWPSCALS